MIWKRILERILKMSMSILYFKCSECDFYTEVPVDDKSKKLLVSGETLKCCVCDNALIGSRIPFDDGGKPIHLSFGDFYKAVNGLGLPIQSVTSKEPIVAMLLAHKIVDVDITDAGDRCVINSISLDNGAVLHMAASGFGAAVFKVTRRNLDASNRSDESEQSI
jgi:hypothetical protein